AFGRSVVLQRFRTYVLTGVAVGEGFARSRTFLHPNKIMLLCQSFISDKARYMSEKLLPTETDLSAFEPALFGAMRRLQQAGEVHAKRLARFGGLTPMQLMILGVMAGEGRMPASGLSRRGSLSAATLSGMLERLEGRGVLLRQRDAEDRRRQWLSVSAA